MKRFRATATRTISLPRMMVIILVTSVAIGSTASAQDVNIRSQIFVDGLLARGVRHELTVPNVLNVPIMLDSVTISISNRKDLKWAEPNWEVIPFLNFLVFKVRNDGWEDFHGRELDPFAVPGQFAPERDPFRWDINDVERARKLIDRRSSPIVMKEPVADWRFIFVRLAPDAEAFDYVYYREEATRGIPKVPAFLNMDNPRPHRNDLRSIRSPKHTSEFLELKKQMPKSEPVPPPKKVLPECGATIIDKPAKKATVANGRAVLYGSMTPLGGGRIEHYFQTSVLQLAPHSERELFVSDLCGAALHGGVAPGGIFLFGNEVLKEEKVAMMERIYGITVDMRGTTGDFVREYPVNRMIGPKADDPKVGPMTFDLRFLTDRPAEFAVHPKIKWHVGTNKPVVLGKKEFDIRITFPKVHEYSWQTTAHFVKQLLESDTSALARCRKVIDDDDIAPKLGTLAEAAMIERLYVDALLVLSVKGDKSDAVRLKKCARRLFSSVEGKDLDSKTRQGIALESLPFLCYVDPEAATKLVRHFLLKQHDEKKTDVANRLALLSLAMSCDPILQRLLQNADGLESLTDEKFLSWSTSAFLLACHRGMPVVEKILADSDGVGKDRLLACAAFAACTTPNADAKPILVRTVRKYLRDKSLDLSSATSILRSLHFSTNLDFRDDVRILLKNCPRGMSAAEVLYAGLRFLEAVKTTSADEPLLRELSTYYYRSEVRDIAKKLLKAS